jgi:hypothetical protein
VIALPLSAGVGVFEAEPDSELGPGDIRAFLDEGLSLMETNPVLAGSDAGRFLPLPAESKKKTIFVSLVAKILRFGG